VTNTDTQRATFPTDVTGLTDCRSSEVVELRNGDTFELRIAPVAKRIGDDTVRMLAYNGSIPGPTIRVRQGSEVTVRVRNEGDHETTVHWHGLRLDNRFDGVPHETQSPIPVGATFDYRLRFPDDGVYWYHPHVREDYGLEMGLYGNILVDPAESGAWRAVNREAIVTLDDVLLEDGRVAAFRIEGPTHTAMGRFGNVMLTGGHTSLDLHARRGEVVRFFFTNTANTRIFNASLPGARMKLVGGDSGRYEHEQFIEEVLLSPSERAIVDVLFETTGELPINHTTPHGEHRLGSVTVSDQPVNHSFIAEFETLHRSEELAGQRDQLDADLQRAPDKTLVLAALMPILYGDGDAAPASTWTCPMHPDVLSTEPGNCPQCGMKLVPTPIPIWTCPMHPEVLSIQPGLCPQCGMKLIPADPAGPASSPTMHEHGPGHAHDTGVGLEWEDLMPDINARTDATNMIWKLVDTDSGRENQDIDWTFRVGDRVKIRLVNTMDSDHPMHHPFHVHGAGRFLVIARDEVPEANLVWKDTVLIRAGETVDIVLDVTSPGLWMAHCHIAEHNQDGMMFSFRVTAA
jgi:FtsP/CotA-like multicopper oxidase with cupredoxin domain